MGPGRLVAKEWGSLASYPQTIQLNWHLATTENARLYGCCQFAVIRGTNSPLQSSRLLIFHSSMDSTKGPHSGQILTLEHYLSEACGLFSLHNTGWRDITKATLSSAQQIWRSAPRQCSLSPHSGPKRNTPVFFQMCQRASIHPCIH